MIELYKKNPVRCIIALFIVGLILIMIGGAIRAYIPERISRSIEEEIKTPEGVYEGQLEFGVVDGEGKFTWKNGDYYIGDFIDNEIAGEGKIVLADGGYYFGDFQEGIRSGSGEFKWANGNIYTGSWSNDKITGEGTITYTNGDTLEGFFKNGVFQSGIYTTKRDSAAYVIAFEDDNVTNVTIEYANGIIYDGGYKNNAFNGNGTLTYDNGDEYVGEFVNGKKDGQGEYTWKDGSHYTGYWADDKMEGQGVYFYPVGTDSYKLQGEFSNNRPNGRLDYYVEKTTSYETDWKNGKCIKLME